NIGEFVTRFNEGTKEMRGQKVPVVIRVYEDRTFDLEFKKPPATSLILKAVGKDKGAGKTGTQKLGTLSKKQLREIAEAKIADLNAGSIEAAEKILAGSARSMGVDVK
ncbi:MAG: 50S ribosomal protein L11, partial [bacterium]|nr:50S ribosomal protein L11 [bacterium]